jgi:hypothetical protein
MRTSAVVNQVKAIFGLGNQAQDAKKLDSKAAAEDTFGKGGSGQPNFGYFGSQMGANT